MCNSCEVGTVSHTEGQTLCIPCSAGLFGEIANTTGNPACSLCPEGRFQAKEGQSSCEPCPLGKEALGGGKDRCTSCARGSYRSQNMTSCQQCVLGRVSAELASQSCSMCRPGYFNAQYGQISCSPCPAGQFADGEGFEKCTLCKPGSSSAANASACTPCAPGYEASASGSQTCVQCTPAGFAPAKGTIKCDVCADYALHSSGTEDSTWCECDAGFVSLHLDEIETSPLAQRLDKQRIPPEENKLGFYCVECPLEAVCLQPGESLATISPRPGFFMGSDGSNATFYECFNDACVNGEETCAPGFTGLGCTQCEEGYISTSGYSCSECLELETMLIIFVLVFFFCIVLTIKYISQQVKKTKQPADPLIKIALSGFQMNTLALAYQFQYTEYMNQVLKIEREIASIGTAYLQLDCFWHPKKNAMFYVMQIIFLLVPIVLIGILPAFLLYLKAQFTLCRERWNQGPDWDSAARTGALLKSSKRWWIVTVVTLSFLLYPTFVERFLLFFSCQRMDLGDDELYLSADLTLYCWTKEHWYWIIVVRVPMGIVYVLGIPLMGFFIIRRGFLRHQLFDAGFLSQFGFLFYGYKMHNQRGRAVYAWDMMLQLRKFLVAAIAVFFADNAQMAALLAQGVIVCVLCMQIFMDPFFHPLLNAAEVYSLACSAGIFYL